MSAPVKLIIDNFLTQDERAPLRGRGGIYRIVHAETGKSYIGSAVNLLRRWSAHWGNLTRNRHHSKHLQSAWNKYGANAFRFECLEIVVAKESLLEREQFWLDHYGSYAKERGYNSRTVAHSNAGYVPSAETREKISRAGRGRAISAETREKIRLSRLNTERQRPPLTEEQRAERRAHLSQKHKGIKRSPEARERIRQGQLKRAPFSDEIRRNISLSLTGRVRSEAERRAMSLGQMGRKHSPETRAKMAASQQNRRLHETAAP